jgi:Gram-negative bacterial TonB protein C-terminal
MSLAPEPLAATIPCGAVLSGLWRILLPSDRRDEFVGDLVEEARLRLRFGSRFQLAVWLWIQTLRSVPPLCTLRVRRLAAAWLGREAPVQAMVIAGGSTGRLSGPLSVALSLAVHAVVLVAAVWWVLLEVDEVAPPRPRFHVLAGIWGQTSPRADPVNGPAAEQQPPARRSRPARRATRSLAVEPMVLAPAPPAPHREEPPLTAAPALVPPPGPPLGIPVKVAEKRCLSCPRPELPPAYARLGAEQQMLVKTCVGVNGRVTSVDVVAGFDSRVSERVTETVRAWRLAPYSLDGHPVPFCYPTRFIFASR